LKRLTDTEKWDKFLAGLKPAYKLLWIYITDKCDNAGIWTVNFDIAKAFIGLEIEPKKALIAFGHRIKVIEEGRKWWIVPFPAFQEKGQLNSRHNRQTGIITTLQKYDLLKLITIKTHKSEKGAIVYEISDSLSVPSSPVIPIVNTGSDQDTYEDTYPHTYADSYVDTISVPVSVTVSESVTETESVSEADDPPEKPPKPKVYKFTLVDIEREDLQTFGYLHPELKKIPAGKPVDELTWLAGRVIKYKRGQIIQDLPFIEALARAVKNLQSEDWFLKSGGVYWLLDVKAGKFNGEQAVGRIGKYLNNTGPPQKSVKDKIQDEVESFKKRYNIQVKK